MKQIIFLLLTLIIVGLTSCVRWQSYKAEEVLHQGYIQQARKLVGQEEDVEQYQVATSPVVIFQNLTRYKLHVTVSLTRGREPVRWRFALDPKEVKRFTGESPGPTFHYDEVYQVEAFRERGRDIHYGSFRIRIRPSYDVEWGYYNGGYEFRP